MNRQFLARYLITKLLNVRVGPGLNDIAIFSSRRSGSTWLMELISEASRIKFIAEPLNEDYMRHLRIINNVREQYISLDSDELQAVTNYLCDDSISSFCGPINPLHVGYHFLYTRRVIKSTNANALIPTLTKKNIFNIVYLIRHPVPQIISTRKYPYASTLGQYVTDDQFMQKYLTVEQQSFAKYIYYSKRETDKYIVGWCLDNLVPLRLLRSGTTDRPFVVTYEDLVTNTQKCIDVLSDRLKVKFRKSIRARFTTPSWTSRFSSADRIAAIQNGNRQYLIGSWRDRDLAEFANLPSILAMYGIFAYKINELYATRSLRLPQ